MQFESEAQRTAYEMISSWMQELFGDQVAPMAHRPGFIVYVGSTAATVTVTPWGNDDGLIESSALVVRGAYVGEFLMRYLLTENNNRLFGAFSIDAHDSIFFQHNLIASTCQRNELETSVLAVVQTADYYDDIIVAKYGGYRGLDLAPEDWDDVATEAPADSVEDAHEAASAGDDSLAEETAPSQSPAADAEAPAAEAEPARGSATGKGKRSEAGAAQ